MQNGALPLSVIDSLMEDRVVVGIDLGTTTSCGAIFRNGQLENISRSATRSTIDSVIKIDHGNAVCMNINPGTKVNTGFVYEIKRLIGRKYEDVKEEVEKNKWPFEVVEGENGFVKVKVRVQKEEHIYKPEEIASFILSNIKKSAETYLDKTINSCVIGCPVDFTQDQRNATISAGILAGFDKDHISLIAESTAAAIAYANKFDAKTEGRRVYVVYDFGGGTFDASVVERIGTSYRTLSTAGDHNSGGKDIDVALMNHVIMRLERKGKRINPRRIGRLKFGCKQAKEELLCHPNFSIPEDFIVGCDEDDPEDIDIRRAELNVAAKPIIQKTIEVVKEAMTKCSPPVKANEVDFVFLAGGSSKLSVVKEELKKMFGENKIRVDSYNLCECAIAYGATLVGYNKKLSGNTGGFIDEVADGSGLQFVDKNTFGIKLRTGDAYTVLIPENSPTNQVFWKYIVPPSALSTSCSFQLLRYSESDSMKSLGYFSVPVKDYVLKERQPIRIEARMMGAESLQLKVIKELEHEECTMQLNPSMRQDELDDVSRSSAIFRSKEEKQKEIDDYRNQLMDRVTLLTGDMSAGRSERLNALLDLHNAIEESTDMNRLRQLETEVDRLSR